MDGGLTDNWWQRIDSDGAEYGGEVTHQTNCAKFPWKCWIWARRETAVVMLVVITSLGYITECSYSVRSVGYFPYYESGRVSIEQYCEVLVCLPLALSYCLSFTEGLIPAMLFYHSYSEKATRECSIFLFHLVFQSVCGFVRKHKWQYCELLTSSVSLYWAGWKRIWTLTNVSGCALYLSGYWYIEIIHKVCPCFFLLRVSSILILQKYKKMLFSILLCLEVKWLVLLPSLYWCKKLSWPIAECSDMTGAKAVCTSWFFWWTMSIFW